VDRGLPGRCVVVLTLQLMGEVLAESTGARTHLGRHNANRLPGACAAGLQTGNLWRAASDLLSNERMDEEVARALPKTT